MIIVAFVTSQNWKMSFKQGTYKAMMHLYHGIHLHHGILLSTKQRDCGYTQENEWISSALCYVKKSQMLKGCHLQYDSIYVTFSLMKSYRNRKQMNGCLRLEYKGT